MTTKRGRGRADTGREAVGGGVSTLVGRGFYSIPEASRLTDLPISTVRRCMFGYEYKLVHGVGRSDSSFAADLVSDGPHAPHRTLSFRDLIELRMVKLFRSQRVTGAEIRQAQSVAAKWLRTKHPFATGKFRTLGKKILMEAGGEVEHSRLVEIARSQDLMSEIIEPFTREVRFEGNTPVLWTHPRGHNLVVLDPHRSFGHPIVRDGGVPTYILAEAASSWGPPEEVARWYEVRVDEVKAALDFERRHVA